MRALGELRSLGAGLSGGRSTDEGSERLLWSVSVRFIARNEVDPWDLSRDVGLTLALTLPRLPNGSKEIVRGFGTGTWPISIES